MKVATARGLRYPDQPDAAREVQAAAREERRAARALAQPGRLASRTLMPTVRPSRGSPALCHGKVAWSVAHIVAA